MLAEFSTVHRKIAENSPIDRAKEHELICMRIGIWVESQDLGGIPSPTRRDVRSMAIMCMISIVMAKSPKEVTRVSNEEVSKGYAMHVKVGSTPVCSSM